MASDDPWGEPCASDIPPLLELRHDGEEDPADGQCDEVVDQRHRRGIAEIHLPERDLDQIDRQKGRGLTRTAAGDDEGSV